MSASRVYLDHNATSPLRPEARRAVLDALDVGGNASAVTREGRAARAIIEAARADVAQLVGAPAEAVTFTSCGSEGAAMLLAPGFARAGAAPVQRLVVSAVEHSCVAAGGRFAPGDVTVVPVDADGVVDLAALGTVLAADPRPALVALMLANNETGVVQPVAEAAAIAHAAGGLLVCDAVQGLGKLDVSLDALGVDALILSGHKIGAPQGVGAVVFGDGVVSPPALVKGGGQERRKRAGTENLAGIAGFGAAARVVEEHGAAENRRMRTLRDWMEEGLRTMSPDVVVFAGARPRLPNTSSIALAGLSGETAVIAFDLAGVSVATGSACASGKVAPSHVLSSMGVAPVLAEAAIRVSLGWSTEEADVARFLEVWKKHRDTVFARRGRAA